MEGMRTYAKNEAGALGRPGGGSGRLRRIDVPTPKRSRCNREDAG